MKRLGVSPSVRLSQQRAAGLLLWARRAGDVDRLLHDVEAAQRVAAKAAVHCYSIIKRLLTYLKSHQFS